MSGESSVMEARMEMREERTLWRGEADPLSSEQKLKQTSS